ncbi:hypothetical protein BHE74_00051411, partial [Ensete ventricosum]
MSPMDAKAFKALRVMRSCDDFNLVMTDELLVEVRKRYNIPNKYALHALLSGNVHTTHSQTGLGCRSMPIDGIAIFASPRDRGCLEWWQFSPSKMVRSSWQYMIAFLGECRGASIGDMGSLPLLASLFLASFLLPYAVESSAQAFRRDPGHPQWHHGAFHDVLGTVRDDVRRMLHTRAEVCNFDLYRPVRVVHTGPPGYRYADCPLPGGFVKNRPSTVDFGCRRLIEEEIDLRRSIEREIDRRRSIEEEKGKKKRKRKKKEEGKKECLASVSSSLACRRRPW